MVSRSELFGENNITLYSVVRRIRSRHSGVKIAGSNPSNPVLFIPLDSPLLPATTLIENDIHSRFLNKRMIKDLLAAYQGHSRGSVSMATDSVNKGKKLKFVTHAISCPSSLGILLVFYRESIGKARGESLYGGFHTVLDLKV